MENKANVIEVISAGAVQSISQFHTVSYVNVQMSPNPKDRDVYMQGGYMDGSWVQTYALTSTGLAKLMNAAGIQELSSNRTDDGSHPYLVSWQYKAKWVQPDSTELIESADYTCDLRGWIDIPGGRVRGARFEKAYMEDRDMLVQKRHTEVDWRKTKKDVAESMILKFLAEMSPEEREELETMAEALALRRITQSRLFITQLAQTGALDRVIRKFLSLKPAYTAQELSMPFSVPRSRFDWDRMDKVIGVEAAGNMKLIQAMKLLNISPAQYLEMKQISAPVKTSVSPDPEPETVEHPAPDPIVVPPQPSNELPLHSTAAALDGEIVEPEKESDTFMDYTEGALTYRKWQKSGRIETQVFGKFREAHEQIGKGLSDLEVKKIMSLFASGRPEFVAHLKKHFRVGTGAAMTWEQLAALIAWKVDERADPRWYADKIVKAEVPTVKPSSNKWSLMFGIEDLSTEDAKAFLEDIEKIEKPDELLSVLNRYGATWEKHHEGIRNLVTVLAQGVITMWTPDFELMCDQAFLPF